MCDSHKRDAQQHINSGDARFGKSWFSVQDVRVPVCLWKMLSKPSWVSIVSERTLVKDPDSKKQTTNIGASIITYMILGVLIMFMV